MKVRNPITKTILTGAFLLAVQFGAWSAPEHTITDVFYSGDAGGYHTYRIPAVVRANDGTLLAFCEGRASNSDLGDIDIILKRSTDNGVTWGSLIIAQSEGTMSIGNPAPVVDRTTGDIHMLFCRENERVFHTVSTDNGLTWATRTEITANVKLPSWGWYATGPCHGVQLTRGDQAGRLVIPANHAIGSGASDTVEKGAQFLYSDDHGATWHMDAYFERAESAGGVAVAPNESTLVELNTPGDGGTGSHVYMNSRDYGTDPGNRSETWSGDGGGSFSVPYNGNPHFVTPVCQGSLIRFSATDEGDAQNRIIFSSPNSSSRANGSLWTTTNETATWSAPKQLFAEGYAYSDMTKTASGHLGVLAECNPGSVNYDYIKFIRVNEEWLDELDTTPPTPDPPTFSQAPVALNSGLITMTATAGVDASNPVEYLFTETSGNPGGTSSGWTTSLTHINTGVSPETQYTYTVTLRDAHGNTGTSSVPVSVTTPAGLPGLLGYNLSFEDDGVSSAPFTGWTLTSLGSDPMDTGDFRTALDPDNWFEDSTAGTHVMLLEGDNGNEYGRLSQQLTGIAAEGTYTWNLQDVGVSTFGDNNNAEFKFGFSLDGTNLIAGSRMTLTEGTHIFSPDTGSVANFQVTYTANDTDTLYLIIETTGAHTDRSVPTIGSTFLSFVAGPVDPPSATPGNVLDIDFGFLSAQIGDPDGLDDGDRIQDVSGNGYHGFFGATGGDIEIVATPNGTGIDNTTGISSGYIFIRDGLTGIPEEWDGPTTTVTPYFSLDGSATGSWTLEAVVKWDSDTVTTRNGIMGQTGGNQIWIREDGGTLDYAIGAGDAVASFGAIDISAAKADGEFHGIALVYDGAAGEVRTYLDGTLLDTNTDADIGTLGTLLDGTGDFRLADYNGGSNYDGTMDHFRISDYALAPSEFINGQDDLLPATLMIEAGPDGVTLAATDLSASAINTLQSKLDLSDGTWSNLYSVTGVTETNWVVAATNQSFFRVESTY